jgi:molybdenum cofactor cytidylyltransferase
MTVKKKGFSVVILAAGESKRFGSPKQLAEFGEEPLLVHVINKITSCEVEPYIAVGANSKLIREHEAFYPYLRNMIPIKNWQGGLSETIKESVEFLKNMHSEGVIFLLADQPLIPIDFLKQFFLKVENNPAALLCTVYKSNRISLGVPAYFPRLFFNELLLVQGDRGAKSILEKYNSDYLSCNDGLLDIDEPEDLAQALSIFKKL